MGIRFRCHLCEHELNLKNFQAGRRARCPVCSGRFRVPTTSCDFSAPLEEDEQELASTTLRAEQPRAGRGETSPTFELQQPTGDLERFKRPATENQLAGAVKPGTAVKPSNVVEPKLTAERSPLSTGPSPAPSKNLVAKKNAATQAAETDAAQQDVPGEKSVTEKAVIEKAVIEKAAAPSQWVTGAPAKSDSAGQSPGAKTPRDGVVDSAQATPAARTPAIPRAVAEAPQAVWYVRPPSGGQFGPADSTTFYQWMQENRVSREALVWRDGWPQWMIAGEAFDEYYGPKWLVPDTPVPSAEQPESLSGVTELGGANIVSTSSDSQLADSPSVVSPTSEADLLETAGVTQATSPVRPLGRRKRRQPNYALGISVLAIVAIVLVVVLISVLMSQ